MQIAIVDSTKATYWAIHAQTSQAITMPGSTAPPPPFRNLQQNTSTHIGIHDSNSK